MDYLKKKIKSHKKESGSDEELDTDECLNQLESKGRQTQQHNSEDWQFFQQLTQKVQDTLQKTQTNLSKLKEESAISVLHKSQLSSNDVETKHFPSENRIDIDSSFFVPDQNKLSSLSVISQIKTSKGSKPPPRPPPPKRSKDRKKWGEKDLHLLNTTSETTKEIQIPLLIFTAEDNEEQTEQEEKKEMEEKPLSIFSLEGSSEVTKENSAVFHHYPDKLNTLTDYPLTLDDPFDTSFVDMSCLCSSEVSCVDDDKSKVPVNKPVVSCEKNQRPVSYSHVEPFFYDTQKLSPTENLVSDLSSMVFEECGDTSETSLLHSHPKAVVKGSKDWLMKETENTVKVPRFPSMNPFISKQVKPFNQLFPTASVDVTHVSVSASNPFKCEDNLVSKSHNSSQCVVNNSAVSSYSYNQPGFQKSKEQPLIDFADDSAITNPEWTKEKETFQDLVVLFDSGKNTKGGRSGKCIEEIPRTVCSSEHKMTIQTADVFSGTKFVEMEKQENFDSFGLHKCFKTKEKSMLDKYSDSEISNTLESVSYVKKQDYQSSVLIPSEKSQLEGKTVTCEDYSWFTSNEDNCIYSSDNDNNVTTSKKEIDFSVGKTDHVNTYLLGKSKFSDSESQCISGIGNQIASFNLGNEFIHEGSKIQHSEKKILSGEEKADLFLYAFEKKSTCSMKNARTCNKKDYEVDTLTPNKILGLDSSAKDTDWLRDFEEVYLKKESNKNNLVNFDLDEDNNLLNKGACKETEVLTTTEFPANRISTKELPEFAEFDLLQATETEQHFTSGFDPFDTNVVQLTSGSDPQASTDTTAFEAFAAKFEEAIKKQERTVASSVDEFDSFVSLKLDNKLLSSDEEDFNLEERAVKFSSPKNQPDAIPVEKLPKKPSEDSFSDEDEGNTVDFSFLIKPKIRSRPIKDKSSLQPMPLLPPPPRSPDYSSALSTTEFGYGPRLSEGKLTLETTDKLPEQEIELPAAFGESSVPINQTDSSETASPLFDDDISEPLEDFISKSSDDGWELLLRQPIKRKITGSRFWKKVYVKFSENSVVQLFSLKEDSSPFQEVPLQACYSMSEISSQQYDVYGKIFTVKLHFVFYRERVGVRPGQISKVIQGQVTSISQIGKLGLPLQHVPQISSLLKLGSQSYKDIKTFVQAVEDTLFHLPTHRDQVMNHKAEEVQVTVYDEMIVHQDKNGQVLKQKARVRVFFLSFISGMPIVEVGLNDIKRQGMEVVGRHDIIPVTTEEWIRLENCEFHSCVFSEDFANSRTIRFQPPDACNFELVRFRVRPPRNRELPLQVKALMTVSSSKAEIRCDLLVPGCLNHKREQIPCENIQIRLPVPECWVYLFRMERHHKYGTAKSTTRQPGKMKGFDRIKATVQTAEPSLIQVSVGQAKYEHSLQAVVWRISRLPKEGQGAYTTQFFLSRLNLTCFDQIPNSVCQEVNVEFSMPATIVSHTTVRSVSIPCSSPPEKFVRYSSKHEYQIEMDFKFISADCDELAGNEEPSLPILLSTSLVDTPETESGNEND
ncbi:uncharacterized protein LOC106467754 [Limulus polyphemus]|uniref:Uncharacterized protein LOC106467754 n=1 Tax=Limulus polyphemus TaxID=6850 RepID=A0ABM1T6Z2_LIMPO|nr:uncharacterized protein LOC106467754 [Limulus polyphemus]XP_022251648.1 uncharacterized protein LOC106467754 [Limulus polyphemus]XP_022251650.1 uncharacterized protein LOC106467754 [Limulus polyphemus]